MNKRNHKRISFAVVIFIIVAYLFKQFVYDYQFILIADRALLRNWYPNFYWVIFLFGKLFFPSLLLLYFYFNFVYMELKHGIFLSTIYILFSLYMLLYNLSINTISCALALIVTHQVLIFFPRFTKVILKKAHSYYMKFCNSMAYRKLYELVNFYL